MVKLKGSKRIKYEDFNFGNIIIIVITAVVFFLIGKAVGKKEKYSPIMINEYTNSDNSIFVDENVRQRLHLLSQI